MRRQPLPAPRRTLQVVIAALAVGMSTLVLQPTPASSGPPKVGVIKVVEVSSFTAPLGTPDTAVPNALVQAGTPFTVRVNFFEADGVTPASFSKDTRLTITTNSGTATNVPDPASDVAPAGQEWAELTTSLPEATNQVSVTVSVPKSKGPSAVVPGTSSPFDVLKEIRNVEGAKTDDFSAGIGGLEVDDDGGTCTEATPEDPVCGTVVLPLGAASENVLLSLGLCDTAYARCSSRGSVVQLLADLTVGSSDLYTATAPAALIIRCDKDLCGRGAIKNQGLNYTLSGKGALGPAQACPAKNTLGRDPDDPDNSDNPLNQEVCVDYVQSTRDGAGDTILYLLFTRDARVSVR